MAEFRVGTCSVDVTPTQHEIDTRDLWLGGYVGRMEAGKDVAHPLSARAIVVEDAARKRFALVTLDTLGVQQDFTDRIRARVQPLGLDPGSVMVNSVHTHSAPISRPFPIIDPAGHGDPDPGFLSRLENGAVQAIETALGQLGDANLFFGRGDTDIGMNRRPTPGPYDPTVDVLVAKNAATGAVISVVFFHGCHPVSAGGGFSITPDFPGPARDRVEELNPGACAIFVQGFAGTVNPARLDPGATEALGTKLASDVQDVVGGDLVALSGLMRINTAMVDLGLRTAPDGDYLGRCIANPSGGSEVENSAEIRWATMIRDALNDPGTVTKAVPTEIRTIKIGAGANGWRLVTSSNEVVNEWSGQVRAIWAEPNITTLAGYTGSVDCYLPNAAILNATPSDHPPPDFGNYEGSSSFMYYGLPSALDPAVDVTWLAALSALDPPA